MRKGSVAIATLKLMDPLARKFVSDYRRQYAIELSKLLLDLGYEAAWFQPGNGWHSQLLPEVPVFGVLRDGAQLLTWPATADDFYEKAHGFDWCIYFDLILAYPQVHESSIAVAHGISWDDPLFEAKLPTEAEREEWKRRLWMALRAPQKVVTVESGLIHWATATWPGLYNTFEYLPNFIPAWAEEEAPVAARPGAPESCTNTVRILFPGPLTPEAGISETIRAMETLLEMDDRIEFQLANAGPAATVKYLTEWSEKHPRRLLITEPVTGKILKQADLVLLPGKSFQETDMICLAAMSLGKTVIVGQNSGLADLVIHDHNGIIINPSAEVLIEVIRDLINSPEERRHLGDNARAVAQHFALPVWRRRWQRLIEKIFR